MAATGYIVGQTCLDTSAHAIEALQSMFPAFLSGNWPLCSVANISFVGPATFNLITQCGSIEKVDVKTITNSIILPRCDPAYLLGSGVSNDAINATNILYVFSWGFGAVIFFFFFGFVIGAVAKVIGKT
jgi:hypothetical protein